MTITENQIQRLKNDWIDIANESLEIECIGNTFYAHGSELATLRLFKSYNLMNKNDKARQSFSKNLNTYVFALDISPTKDK